MGYKACRDAGMGNAGYASANDRMYWRMYAGHNCTNYAAYRMVRSGMPNERPWSGGGNATYWGTSMSHITDGTPRVGAVAWWRANTGPAGSSGHVAYVEKVVSADEIIISQDSWGGDFSWAVVTRGSGNWPSGFVHFNDKPLTNTQEPTIDGVAKVGSTLRATPGAWRPGAVHVSYQWLADGKAIKKGVESTFRLTRARVGQHISVRATATRLGFPTRSAVSAPTAAVLPGQLRNTAQPSISGNVQVDSTLTLHTGTWTPAPNDLRVQWYADGQAIPDATDTRLTLAPELVSRVITAEVTATREHFESASAETTPTAPVRPGTFAITTAPHLTGTPQLGEVLTAEAGRFAPSDARVTIQWLRNGTVVGTGSTYRITNVDLGSRIWARVSLSRAGYEPTELATAKTPRIRTDAKVRLQTEPGKHRVRVTVTLTVPGLDEVTGTVAVRMAGVAKTVELSGGTARVTLAGLPPGKRTLTVRYAGSSAVKRAVVTRTVRIR